MKTPKGVCDLTRIAAMENGSGFGRVLLKDVSKGTIVMQEMPFLNSDDAKQVGKPWNDSFAWNIVEKMFKQQKVKEFRDAKLSKTEFEWEGDKDDAVCKRLASRFSEKESDVKALYFSVCTNNLVSETRDVGFMIGSQQVIFKATNKHGIYMKMSRVNHSCNPNCEMKIRAKCALQLVATRDIKAGTEISYNYIHPTPCNHKQIRERFFFECKCSACVQTVQ